MAWGNPSLEDQCRLKPGGVCSTCRTGTICFNGSVSRFGYRIATCSRCPVKLCVYCGETARGDDRSRYWCPCRKPR